MFPGFGPATPRATPELGHHHTSCQSNALADTPELRLLLHPDHERVTVGNSLLAESERPDLPSTLQKCAVVAHSARGPRGRRLVAWPILSRSVPISMSRTLSLLVIQFQRHQYFVHRAMVP